MVGCYADPRRLFGIRQIAAEAVADMQSKWASLSPCTLAESTICGEFAFESLRRSTRSLAMQAADQGVSLNRPGKRKAGWGNDACKQEVSDLLSARSRAGSSPPRQAVQ